MKKALIGLVCIVAVALGCAASQYAANLDSCAAQNLGNPAAIAQCQCAVSQAAGRDCSWLDGGAGGWLPEAGADVGAQ